MNKKLLLNQNKILFDKLQVANLSLKRVKEENTLLKSEIEKLNGQIAAYSSRALPMASISDDNPTAENDITEVAIAVEANNEVEPPEFDAETEFASEIIGQIVIQAAKYSKILNESGKSNIKELINLVLGKTEVVKVEIFNILSSEASFELKCEMISTQYDETVEYFKSIIEQ